MTEIVRESLNEVLRYIMYYNFHFYLVLILNKWCFAVKSLFNMFLAFSSIVHQYLIHHFMIVLLWINTHCIICYTDCGLMLVDKVTSSIHVDYIGVPSILVLGKRSWYILIILWGLLEREHKRKKMMHHLQNLNQSARKDEEIKEDEYHAWSYV